MFDSMSFKDNSTFAQVNRKVKKEMNVDSKFDEDSLADQTVSSLGSSSFVYNTELKTVEHRFLRVARTLDIEENARYSTV